MRADRRDHLENIELLVSLVKRGDMNAFEKLFLINKEKLFRIAMLYMKCEDKALDAMHESILKALQSINGLRENKHFHTWFVRILINQCKHILAIEKRVVNLFDKDTYSFDLLEADKFFNLEDRIDLIEGLKKLNTKAYEVLVMKYFMDLSLEEIAQTLKCSKGTIKSRLHYSLKKLRKYLIKKEN